MTEQGQEQDSEEHVCCHCPVSTEIECALFALIIRRFALNRKIYDHVVYARPNIVDRVCASRHSSHLPWTNLNQHQHQLRHQRKGAFPYPAPVNSDAITTAKRPVTTRQKKRKNVVKDFKRFKTSHFLQGRAPHKSWRKWGYE